MAFSITQTPARLNLAQSPIVFTVYEDDIFVTERTAFQYVGELYYWTGSLTQSGSEADYTLVKFKNSSDRGIFDINRILYSTLDDLAQQNTSNVKNFAVDFYWQYLSGSSFITGSHIKSDTYSIIDGYAVFPEPIGQTIADKSPYWPLMTDGPKEQEVLQSNRGTIGLYLGPTGTVHPDYLIYSSSLGTTTVTATGAVRTNTTGSVVQIPIFPSSPSAQAIITGSESYTIQVGVDEGAAVPITPPLKFVKVCETKYPNVRIKWKNRYGQFDYLNCNLASKETFQTTQRTYQPQLGSWEGTSLSYQSFDSSTKNYISDSSQTITVNTNWLKEDYNDILKQLLVSDEIYWIYNEAQNLVRPLTIITSDISFKTGVVDKLIQYEMQFAFGQSYKLII
jgi:hypothetical protein